MFTVDKVEIGRHIADLLEESRFKSARQFGKEYLRVRYGSVDEDAIPNIQNRISQIINGKKWIQMEDLPIFADLLGVSVEDIVSAGTSSTPSSGRVTNYSIAHSDDPAAWDAYINREDKLFLNPDEYNKTIIDYALEAGNYAFLKFLMDKKHIWFVGDDKKQYHDSFGEYGPGFGAGTNIKRRTVGDNDTLDTWLKDKDDLRFKMMSLAIKNKDFEMLTRLHAREIPLLYTINHFLTFNPREDKLPESKNTEQFTQSLASCSNTTLAYFFDSFTVESTIRDEKNTFIFPYAGAVLNQMIKRKEKSATLFLEKATKWNKQILSQLKEAIDDSVKACQDYYAPLNCPDIYNEAFLRAEALRDYYFYPNTGFVAFTSARFSKKAAIRGFITNIVHVTVKSSDPELQFLIDELNESYDVFNTFIQEKEVKHV